VNYLAHAYLSGDDDDILVGNFIADAVKGKAVDTFSGGIRRGIVLHRFIDEFTDHHPLHRASRTKLTGNYGHYAGVLVDIFYDHFLAKNWQVYATVPLPEFTARVYAVVHAQDEILPERIKYMLTYMVPQNWLLNYAHLKGIKKVLRGMANRTKFDSQMEHGVEDLQRHYTDFEAEFTDFFPELIDFARHKMTTLS